MALLLVITMANPRKVAVKTLLKINNKKSYSNITLNAIFKDLDITPQDKALATAIVYGVLDRKITLNYVISNFSKTPINKMNPFTLEVLRVALYQIMFMDKIPDSAAVNEAVKLIKNSKESRNSGFVNAVLRNVLRAEELLPKGNSNFDLSIKYSCPCDIIESFINDYGLETTENLLIESLKPAPLTIKLNTLKTTIDTFKEQFETEFKETDLDNCLVLKNGFDISKNQLYKDGLFFVQDKASQKIISILNPKPNDRLLDMCAAPGGKSFSAGIMMQNKGEIVSCDLYEHKAKLIADGAKGLGIDIIKPKIADATIFDKNLGEFDCVLCDVPCSGLGIIRRKPEIKYKNFKEFDNLCDIQYKILQNSKNYLKSGGRLIYSTCTLRKSENEDIIMKFLSENKNFHLEYSHTFMPHKDNTDGFFVSLLLKD